MYQWEKLKNPVFILPQQDRLGEIIMYISLPVYNNMDVKGEVIHKSVNTTTIIKFPQEPVKEIGQVLKRICTYTKTVPKR